MSSGATPAFFLPYPLQTDPVDVAEDVKSLAIAVDFQFTLSAPLLSPQLTGTPLSVTPNTSDNSTKIATTEYVKNQNYLTTSSASSTYAPIASPTFTGTVSAPTAALGDDSTKVATTEYVQNELENFVTLPVQTGASGKFLKSDGTDASWQTITASDVSGLSTVIDNLATTYAPLNLTIATNTATSRYLSQGDAGKLIQMNNSATNNFYIEADGTSGYTFPVGTQVVIVQSGTGQTGIVAGSSVTIYATPGLKLRTQWSAATAIKVAANTWLVFGDVVS